jgi:hypothetical protein
VPDMSEIETYSLIIEEANQKDKTFHIIKSILKTGIKEIEDKKMLISKQWRNLKSSNCSEQEFRLKKSDLERKEVDEFEFIKQ